MERRTFVGSALAGLAGLFGHRKLGVEPTSGTLHKELSPLTSEKVTTRYRPFKYYPAGGIIHFGEPVFQSFNDGRVYFAGKTAKYPWGWAVNEARRGTYVGVQLRESRYEGR
jgi:hypothetical protein